MQRMIAVASGKGGVGKTWLAITLSHALTRAGERVLLFDGDLGLANVDIQLGLMPRVDLGTVIAGRARLRDAVMRPEGLFDIVAGASGSGTLAGLDEGSLELLLGELGELAGGYDSVVLDLGAGLGRMVRQVAATADVLLVVATDEPTSLTDAYAVLKLHAADTSGERRGAARVVVNQAANRAAGTRTYETLARASANFLGVTPSLAGVIRRDERVRDAIRRQTPLLTRHPATPAAEDVEGIARGLRR